MASSLLSYLQMAILTGQLWLDMMLFGYNKLKVSLLGPSSTTLNSLYGRNKGALLKALLSQAASAISLALASEYVWWLLEEAVCVL